MDQLPIRVLLVDDDEDDYALTAGLLADASGLGNFTLDWARTHDAGLAALVRCEHDVCLLDYHLGALTGLDVLRQARAAGCRVPAIILTGQDDREVDLQAMRVGATDYLLKGGLDATDLERAIRYAVERSKVDRLKDSLVAFASHELRTPVTAIRGYAEMLLVEEGQLSDPFAQESLAHILHATNHLTVLIEGFLDLSRLDAGCPIETVPSEFDVRELVAEALDLQRMAARHCSFTAQVAPDVGVLSADRQKLLLVITNLLSNADKYSPAGGVVRLAVERTPEGLEFSISDCGLGIPPEALPHVFTPFYRVQGGQHRGVRGTGIGLHLCKALVEAHGGCIWLESEVGKGTTAHFTVPL